MKRLLRCSCFSRLAYAFLFIAFLLIIYNQIGSYYFDKHLKNKKIKYISNQKTILTKKNNVKFNIIKPDLNDSTRFKCIYKIENTKSNFINTRKLDKLFNNKLN